MNTRATSLSLKELSVIIASATEFLRGPTDWGRRPSDPVPLLDGEGEQEDDLEDDGGEDVDEGVDAVLDEERGGKD